MGAVHPFLGCHKKCHKGVSPVSGKGSEGNPKGVIEVRVSVLKPKCTSPLHHALRVSIPYTQTSITPFAFTITSPRHRTQHPYVTHSQDTQSKEVDDIPIKPECISRIACIWLQRRPPNFDHTIHIPYDTSPRHRIKHPQVTHSQNTRVEGCTTSHAPKPH